MYQLYHLEGSCSLATLSVMLELGITDIELTPKAEVENFSSINPVGSVPVLFDGTTHWREGAALMLMLLEEHQSPMLPSTGKARHLAIQNIMFANATMHPAYSQLFFLDGACSHPDIKQQLMNKAAEAISNLWTVVDQQLSDQDYLGGDSASAADFMLRVYSAWGAFFPVDIIIPDNVRRMLDNISLHPAFQQALAMQQALQQ